MNVDQSTMNQADVKESVSRSYFKDPLSYAKR